MLNQKQINALQWGDKDSRYRVSDGLYINIRKSSKTYLFKRIRSGKVSITTLGKHPQLKLKDAKKQASMLLNKECSSSMTVGELCNKYYKEQVQDVSKIPAQVEGYLNHINIRFNNKKLSDVKKIDCSIFLQEFSKTRGKRTADRLKGYMKQVFSYAVELGLIDNSPMDGITSRVTRYKPTKRTRVLSDDEIKMVFNWNDDNAKVIKFLLLTGLRISEALSGYIDDDYFRVDDTKNGLPHWVFLTDTAKALLPLPKCTQTNIQNWLKRTLIDEGVEPRFTPHDARRSFVTIANGYAEPYIVEKTVNHKMLGVMAVYNHNEYKEERIQVFKYMEKYILRVIK